MSPELEKICRMLQEGSAELQCAAARVLGELQACDAGVLKALARTLRSSNETVKLYAVDALAKIDASAAAPHLIPLLGDSDPVRSRVLQALASLGAQAAPVLREHLASENPRVRQGVVELLGRFAEEDSSDALFAALLDPEAEVARKAAQVWRGRARELAADRKAALVRRILEFVTSPRARKAETAVASSLLILGALGDPRAVPALLAHADRKRPASVRQAALAALGELAPQGTAARTAVARLLPLLEETDFPGIVKPALDVLARLPVGKEHVERLARLLEKGPGPVKSFAARALGEAGGARAGEALLGALLQGEDPRLSERAGEALRARPEFGPLLLKALDRASDVAAQWKIVTALRGAKAAVGRAEARRLVARGLALLGKRRSGFQAYFEVARAADPGLLRDSLLRKGRALLGRGKAEDAERHLRILEHPELATPEAELSLGLARLRLQRLDLAQAGRDRGPALSLFARLAAREGFSLARELEKQARWATPEELLYLGFALVERQGAEREAGAAILKLVARRWASREEGRTARQKLKTQGVA
ncbi:MAG TPA: HEAT repeat domain-containing protein [Planctomycetota bacterium]|nr:HEAT repeat domain-containing protein [Planctomycetota bacterium]